MIRLDGFDEAIIGVVEIHTYPPRLVYDYEKMIEILMERDEMEEEEAREFFDFNIGCLWAGTQTPAILYGREFIEGYVRGSGDGRFGGEFDRAPWPFGQGSEDR